MPAARALATSALLLGIALAGPADAGPAGEGGAEFFEKNIRPLLIERCYSCHSAQAKKVGGGLLLDSKNGWEKGGDQGPAIKPGDPNGSLLVEAVRYNDELLKMPPAGKLADREVALLTRWVTMGAPDPRTATAAVPNSPAVRGPEPFRVRDFWASRPPVAPPVPDVVAASWPSTPLDRFILAELEKQGLSPAPPADRRALIRRATFDLTGLPPTAEEVGAFLADDSADAFARLVDRLLASPRYGERWGRHWLDVARYADSNGLDENTAYGNAWRYRDYVIWSMNRDKPYDRFILEQLAGDLLPPTGSKAEAHERLIALGFLALGPKSLAEVDQKKLEMDLIDEQIDTVGRALLGLTLGCARCHDHKFDPITTADYYGLSGIFQSTVTMDTFTKLARWHENSLASERELALQAEHEKKVKALKEQVEGLVRKANEQLKAASGKGDGFKLPEKPEEVYPEATRAELKRRRDELAALEKAAPEVSSALGVKEGKVVVPRILIRGNHLTPGAPVPRRFPVVLTAATATAGSPAIGEDRSGRLELARWLADARHPLTARVMANRIWRWHFGRGLVPTPDNFGNLGGRPTHPRLLDWLACRFVEGGWSIKAMHRLIMLSSTYRMAAVADPNALRIDPDNRHYWRWEPRRLEAEAVRDALLAVAGALEQPMGGPVLHVKNRDYLFDHTSIDRTKYDSRRRSVYLPVIRNNVYDVFQLFDFSDPTVTNGDRASTVVPLQALFMLNGDLMDDATAHLAGRLLARYQTDDSGRIRLLFEAAYGRPPTDAETSGGLRFLARYARAASAAEAGQDTRRRLAWQAYCQVVLASNEFLYVR